MRKPNKNPAPAEPLKAGAVSLPSYRENRSPDAGFPTITTAASPLTAAQMNRVFRAELTVPRLLVGGYVIGLLLLLIWICVYADDWQMLVTAILYYLADAITLGVWTARHRHRWDMARYAAARCKGDVTDGKIEIFSDRAVKTTALGQTVIRFAEVDLVGEAADMLWLRQGEQVIGWRAADLTPEQAAFIRKTVYARIPATRRVFRAAVTGLCDTTRPLPEKQIPPDYTVLSYRPKRVSPAVRAYATVRAWLLPLGGAALAVSTLIAEMNYLSNIYFLDVFAYFVLTFVGAAALFWLLIRFSANTSPHDLPAQIAVTATGVTILRGASTVSYLRADIAWDYDGEGITLSVPRETFTVSFADIADRDAIREFLPPKRH